MSGDVREVFEALQAASISGNVSNEPGEVTAAGQCPVFPAPALEVGELSSVVMGLWKYYASLCCCGVVQLQCWRCDSLSQRIETKMEER